MQTDNLKVLYDLLMDDDKRDEILDLGVKLAKEAFDNTRPGWNYRIVIDVNGDIEYLYSGSSIVLSEHDGTGVCALKVNGFVNNDNIYLESVEDELNEEELKLFKKWLMNEYETNNEDDIEDYINWDEYSEYNEEHYNELLKKTWHLIVDDYGYCQLVDELWDNIEELKRIIEK